MSSTPDDIAERLLAAVTVPSYSASTDTIKHLEFVEAIIARMAANSFLLKGWTVTIVAALLGVAAQQDSALFATAALLPACAFWGLDAYYLQHERLFRRLYDDVRRPPDRRRHPVEPFTLSVVAYRRDVERWHRTLRTHSLIALHGTIVFVILAAIVYFVST